MAERHTPERRPTRQEVAGEIAGAIGKLHELFVRVHDDNNIAKIIGKEAVDELRRRDSAEDILRGMADGGITVGVRHLAEMLARIENSISAISLEEAKKHFEEVKNNESLSISEFEEVIEDMSGITSRAVRSGLTTPGFITGHIYKSF